jgi:hypothetical protein
MLTIALPNVGSTGIAGGVSYSADGKQLAVSDIFTTTIVDATSGAELLTLSPVKSGAVDLAFSHDGHKLAVAGEDGRIWNL